MLAPMMTLGTGAASERAFLGAGWLVEGEASREGEATRLEPARVEVAGGVDLGKGKEGVGESQRERERKMGEGRRGDREDGKGGRTR